MSSEGRVKFVKWHGERVIENYIFDFELELRSYCISDVDILRRRLLKFQKILIELVNTDPLQYITAASLCMYVYQGPFIKGVTIARLPPDGLTLRDQFSKISIAWLEWEMKKRKVHIVHGCNGTEKRIGKYNIGWF